MIGLICSSSSLAEASSISGRPSRARPDDLYEGLEYRAERAFSAQRKAFGRSLVESKVSSVANDLQVQSLLLLSLRKDYPVANKTKTIAQLESIVD